MTDIDLTMAVLSIIRDADNAPSLQMIANRGNFLTEELIQVINSLTSQQLIFSLDEEADRPITSCRFLTVKEAQPKVDILVSDYLSELAGEGRLYFAYGTNLNPDHMYQNRCPGSHFLCRGVLEGYRLVFNQSATPGGMAGFERSPGNMVWGVLYCLPPEGHQILDANQKQISQCRKIRVVVKSCFGNLCCDSYRTPADDSFLPNRQYLEKMYSGAQFFGLPQQYLRWLAALPISN